ncbi:hypothetical protein ACIQBJ_14500 [Kitasatospora sp. NPDC088391]|uniref:hypothetical protein n=1 Tax=Kitasatospora sp. NPDC088391 TaxID=3364074 RepID=UPI0037F55FAE
MAFADHIAAPETDVWTDWLTHADALTAAGDPRGRAIRLEHLRETGDGDAAQAAAAYTRVERAFGLDALRADGSWQFAWSRGRIDTAVFRLDPGSTARRRTLVEHLPLSAPLDPADPEQWEAALVDAFLAHPATRLLRRLELHLTDHHHSAARAAAVLAAHPRPRLDTLYFGHDFTLLFAPHTTSAGNRISPEEHLHDPVVPADHGKALWQALPALRSLELEGAFLFDHLAHDTLAELRTRGAVFSDGSLFDLTTPALTALEVEIGPDVHGTVGSNLQLEDLDPARFPRLRSLDLGAAEFDPEETGDFLLLADHPLLPQLTHLALRELVVEEHHAEDRTPLELLTDLAPRFTHLDLRIEADIEIENATATDLAPPLTTLGLTDTAPQ